MNRSHASAAVLGTSAALAAAFLTQPAPTRAELQAAYAFATPARIARATGALTTMVRQQPGVWESRAAADDASAHHDSGRTRPVALAVCHDCGASHALVNVLLRRHARVAPLSPLLLFTDRPWPALDTLARRTRSSVVIHSELATTVGVTPAAWASTLPHAVLGIPDVLALVANPPHPSLGGSR